MYNHQPPNYKCPMCAYPFDQKSSGVETTNEDVIYHDKFVTAFISSHWWPNNPGHVIVIPNEHVENIYDISDDVLAKVYAFAKRVAVALKKVYKCDATSMRQHNEPAGNQDVWHFHVHVFPRYKGDNLYLLHDKKRLKLPEERKLYALRLRKFLEKKQNGSRR